MIVDKNINSITINDFGKELTIEKNESDSISFLFFNNKINKKSDSCIMFKKSDGVIYDNFEILFENLKNEYNNYQNYFNEIYKYYIDEYGIKEQLNVYSKKYNLLKFYSENGNFNNRSYIRIFKENENYYLYFNRPSMPFIIKESNSKFPYNSFCKYFVEFYDNVVNKNDKIYKKINNFKWEENNSKAS